MQPHVEQPREMEDKTVEALQLLSPTAYAPLASPPLPRSSSNRHDSASSGFDVHPLERAGWLSQLTMWWLNDLILLRPKDAAPLEETDVAPLPLTDRAAHLHERFQRVYQSHCATSTDDTKPTPIHRAMWQSTKGTMGLAVVLYFVSAGAALVQPLLIKWLLEFLQDATAPTSTGYTIAALLTITALVSVSALDFGMFRATRAGIHARSIVVNAVFQKTLALSSTARQAMNSGDIITLAGVDSEHLYEAYANGLWAIVSPVMVLVVCILIAVTMGLLVGLAAFVCSAGILTFAMTNSRRIGKLRRRILVISGERVKVTNEALQGIRVIKMYAWEDAILRRIQSIRAAEIKLLRLYSYLRAANYVVLTMGQTFMAVACLLVYVYAQDEPLTVPVAFALLAFTNVCRMPFSVFSNAAVFANEAWASMDRLAVFLAADQVDITDATHEQARHEDQSMVDIADAEFEWDAANSSRPPTLRGINLSIQPGELIVVVGAVGSGKSSLMSAMLGELHRLKGSCEVRGAIAYASQQPWIQHNTVRDNILFGSPYDGDRYQRVIDACQLRPDLQVLENGDATEIGERGINLSGGQKARVSLARVMYRLADAELLVLDDPLSALDVHVATAVFQQCVVQLAQGKTRLLVLNAHYHLLKLADRVIVMDDGKIVGDGPYEDLRGKFRQLEAGDQNASSPTAEGPSTDRHHQDANPTDKTDVSAEKEAPKAMMVAEDRAVGAVTWSMYAAFLVASGWGSGLVLGVSLFLLFAVGQCAVVASDYFLKFWSDGTLLGDDYGEEAREIYLYWLFFAVAVGATVLSVVRAVVFTELCVQSSKTIHNTAISKVLLAPLATFFDVTPVGRVLNRFSRDLDQIDNPLPYYGLALLVYLMLTLAILAVCAVATPTTLILYAPLAYSCRWLQQKYLQTSRDLKRLDGITRSPYVNLVAETINGLESIRAFAMTKRFADKCHELIDANANVFFLLQQSSNWFVMRLDWLVTLVVVAVAFAVVAWRDSVGAGSAGLALTYAVQLTMNFQRLMTRASATDNFLTSFERLSYYAESLEDEDTTESTALTPVNWPQSGAIEFQHVSLRYRDGLDLVLHDVSFSINHGERVGVCGRTGSGKSSLLNAILRTASIAHGRVLIDGVDVATVPVRQLRAKLTVIPQDPVLFSGTLRENLDPFLSKTDTELYAALRSLRLADEVEKWGAGLDFAVVEKGENVSVGQRQLICIARAMLRQSQVVLVDEATASVDQHLDRLIQLALLDNFKQCTTVTIAHRLETIVQSDRVLVMDRGHVVEFDSPSTLMARQGGHFAGLMASAGV